MKSRLMILLVLASLAALVWFLDNQYPGIYLQKVFDTALALAVLYLLFKIILEEVVARQIKDDKARYHFRKAVSTINLIITGIVVLTIWIQNPEALVVAYGLMAAGITIALQDFFKNIAGGITLFITGLYGVGDRIEVKGVYGDVIDVGILYTTLYEIREWVSGDQATGRLTIIPNGFVLSNEVKNYTKDNKFIWDEISLPLTYDSDWKKASKRFLEIVKKETESVTSEARKEEVYIAKKYYLPTGSMEPAIYVTPTDNWIMLHIRYVTDVRQRRFVANKLSQLLLEEVEKDPQIKIASETFEISGFPEVRVKKTL